MPSATGTLIGRKVVIPGNEFIGQDSEAAIVSIDERNKTILLELDDPVREGGITYRCAVASPRRSDEDLDHLNSSGSLGCAITWVPDDQFNSNEPMNLSWWRGGAAAIADLRIS